MSEFRSIGGTAHGIIFRYARIKNIRILRKGLIPQTKDPGRSVTFKKNRTCIVDPCIYNTDDHPASHIAQCRCLKGGNDPGSFHSGVVQQGKKRGNAVVGLTFQRKGKGVFKLCIKNSIIIAYIIHTGKLLRVPEIILQGSKTVNEISDILGSRI